MDVHTRNINFIYIFFQIYLLNAISQYLLIFCGDISISKYILNTLYYIRFSSSFSLYVLYRENYKSENKMIKTLNRIRRCFKFYKNIIFC